METALIISVTLFFVVVVAYIIYVIVGGFEQKSTQFTMRYPPKPPQTLEEKYFDLKLEAIRLMNEFRLVDAKMKEIEEIRKIDKYDIKSTNDDGVYEVHMCMKDGSIKRRKFIFNEKNTEKL